MLRTAQASTLIFSITLTVYAGAGVVLQTAYPTNNRVMAAACRWLICSNGEMVNHARGRLQELSPHGLVAGRREFRDALQRDPASAHRWLDVAEATWLLGDFAGARYAYDRAVELAPNSPPVLLQAAGFYFRAGHPRDAMPLTFRLLKLVRDYDDAVFLLYSHSGIALQDLLRTGVPLEAAQPFLYYVMDTGSADDAAAVWEWMGAGRLQARESGRRYVEMLLRNRQYAKARDAWVSLAGSAAYPAENLVYNGTFEGEFSGAPFDWSLLKQEYVVEVRDSRISLERGHSLRVSFDGSANLSYQGASQLVVVPPGTYSLKAWIKAEGITTDRGLQVRLFDIEDTLRLDVRTPEVKGSSDWVVVECTATIRSGTNLVKVQLVREPSLKLDNKMAGTAWIGKVELRPKGT